MFNELIYKTEAVGGRVKIPVTFLEKAYEKGLSTEVVTPEGNMYLTPIDYRMDDMKDDVPYAILDMPFEATPTLTGLTPWEASLLGRFHHNWFNLLREDIQEDKFKPLLLKINEDRKQHKIYPAREKMLQAFSFDPDGIRTVFVGEHPKKSELGLWDLDYHKRLYAQGIWWIDYSLTEYEDLPLVHNEWNEFTSAAILKVERPVVITSKALLPYDKKVNVVLQLDLTVDKLEKLYELL